MKENMFYHTTLLGICILLVLSVPSLSAQESKKIQPKNEQREEQTPFDDITWDNVNKENEKENPLVQFWGYLFREREIDTVTGDDLTVVETATFSEDEHDSPPAPVGVVAVRSLQTEE